MTFANPLWLIGLAPWAAAALYLLMGQRRRRDVPFLELWRGPVAAPARFKWKASPPPIYVILAALGLLLALLGSAGPGIPRRGGGAELTLIVDRGLTMSARTPDGLRFRAGVRSGCAAIARAFGPDARLTVIVIPSIRAQTADPGETDPASVVGASAFPASLDAIAPTAIETGQAVRQAVRRALALSVGPVVLVSDKATGIDDRRLVQVRPATPVRNVGIARLSARATPAMQIMVGVRNDSPLARATLLVEPDAGASAAAIRTPIDLPAAGAERDYFIDAPRLGQIVSVRLEADDDLPADNQAWLVRRSAWPTVDLDRPAGPLARLVEIYRTVHPPAPASRRVRVVARPDELRDGESGVIAAALDGPLVRPTRASPGPVVSATADWTGQEFPAGAGEVPAGYEPILWAGDRVLAAVQTSGSGESSSRRLWTVLGCAGWADRPDYVAFWTAAFDWAGGGQEMTWSDRPLAQAGPDWTPAPIGPVSAAPVARFWPGIYRRADGAREAFDQFAPRAIPAPGSAPAWEDRLQRARASAPGNRDLTPIAMIGAIGLVLAAAALWPRSRGRGMPGGTRS